MTIEATRFVTEFFRKDRIPCPARLEKLVHTYFGVRYANQEECIRRMRVFGERDRAEIEKLKRHIEEPKP